MTLIPEADRAHRMASMQAFAAAAIVQLAAITVPPEWLALMPPSTAAYVTLALTIIGAIARLIQQPGVSG